MKNIFYSTFILFLVSSFLFIIGCHREESIHVETTMPIRPESRQFSHIDSIKGLKNYLDRKFSRLEGLRSSYFESTDIDSSNVMIVEYSPAEITYSMPLRSDTTDNWVYNLVILKENGVYTKTMVAALRHFTNGEYGIYQYSFEEAFGTGSRSTTLKECWKSYIKVVSSGNEGQGTFGNGGSSNGSTNNFGNVTYFGGINGWWGNFTSSGGNTGTGNNGGSTGNGNSGGNGSGSPQCDGILIHTPMGWLCIPMPQAKIYTFKDQDAEGSRTLSKECKDLLMRFGFIDEDCNMQEDYGEKLMNDCRRKNAGLSQKIQDAANGAIINPCTGQTFSFDADLLERSLCFDDKYTEEGFDEWLDEQLDGEDHIILPKNFKKDCPCFDKMIKSMDNVSSDNFLCTMINSIIGSTEYLQTFAIVEGGDIKNQINGNWGSIKIPKSYCNGTSGLSDIQLTAKFIHEIMHGYMWTLLHDKYPDGLPESIYLNDPTSPTGRKLDPDIWLDLVKEYNNVTVVDGNHHVLFFTHFKEVMKKALHDINGGIGEPSDYEYYANLLINTADLAKSDWNDELGLGYKDSNGIDNISTFDNNINLESWNNIGGDSGFVLNCD